MHKFLRSFFILIISMSVCATSVIDAVAAPRHAKGPRAAREVSAVDAERVLAEAADPLLEDHLLYQRGTRLLGEGQWDAAAKAFRALLDGHPDSIWTTEARLGLARALVEDKKYDDALAVFAARGRSAMNKFEAFDARLLNARALLGQGDARAVEEFRSLVLSAEEEAQLALATMHFDELDRKLSAGLGSWFKDPAIQYRIAANFMNDSQWDEAAARLDDRAVREGLSEGMRRDADYLYAKALARTNRYGEAVAIFEKLKKGGRDDPELLQWLARTYAKMNKFDDAIAVRREMLRTRRDPSIMAKIAFLLVDQGKYAEAIDSWGEVLAMKPGGDTRADAEWYIAWCNYRLGRFDAAVQDFDVIAKGARGSLAGTRARYWKARALIDAGRKGEGMAVLREVQGGGGYYGMIASRRVRGESHEYATFAGTPKGVAHYAKGSVAGYLGGGSVHLARARALDKIGLGGLAAMEMYATDQDRRGGISDETYRVVYGPLIARDAGGAALDPSLVLALMKIESNFKPDVVSPVGAIGLMQLMPSTARGSADNAEGRFDSRRLFEPEANIGAGVRYLKKLLTMFPGDYVAIIASYNAGEEAVGRWIKLKDKLHATDIEAFIEEIPYDQTNLYVKKVLSNYWALGR